MHLRSVTRVIALLCIAPTLIIGGLCIAALLTPLPSLTELQQTVDSTRIVTLNNQRIAMHDQGLGTPIVLIHGFASSSYSWRMVATDLARDHRVLTLDLYGFGLSDRPAALGYYTPEAQARLVIELMDNRGIHKAYIAGHSYGAHIVEEMVRIAPERILGVSFVSGGLLPAHATTDSERMHSALNTALYPLARGIIEYEFLWHALFATAFGKENPPSHAVSEMYRARLRTEGFFVAYKGFAQSAHMLLPTTHSLGGVRMLRPCVLWGTEDGILDVSLAHTLSRQTGGALYLFDNAGHMLMEERPSELASALRNCMRSP